MKEGVVGYFVSLCRNPANEIRVALGLPARYEERRFDPVRSQHVQQVRRVSRLRAIIECQRHRVGLKPFPHHEQPAREERRQPSPQELAEPKRLLRNVLSMDSIST